VTYLRIRDVEMYSETSGTGHPLLFLHGGFCSLESMRPQFEALSSDHRVVAFERPGHGRSADRDGEFNYTDGIADTLAYLDALGLGAVDIVGYSDGAIIGLLLALEHPERVRSLVAISGNLDPDAFEFGEAGADAPEAAADDAEPDEERAHYDRLSPDGPEHADVVLAKLFHLWTTEPHIDPADLARITAPVLIVSGDRDTIPPAHSRLIAGAIPGAGLHIVPDAGHGLVAEHPETITALIRDFLDARPGDRGHHRTRD